MTIYERMARYPLIFTEHHGEHIMVTEKGMPQFVKEADEWGQIEDMLKEGGGYYEDGFDGQEHLRNLWEKVKQNPTDIELAKSFFIQWSENDYCSEENLRLIFGMLIYD